MAINSLVALLITLVIAGVIFYAIWWFIGYMALPEPFNKVLRVIVGLIALLYLLALLTGAVPRIVW